MDTLCTAAQVLAPLLDRGDIDGPRLQSAQYEFDQFTALQRRQRFMLLQLDPAARAGEPRALDQVTIMMICMGQAMAVVIAVAMQSCMPNSLQRLGCCCCRHTLLGVEASSPQVTV